MKLHRKMEVDGFGKSLIKSDFQVVPKLFCKYLLLSADVYSAGSCVCTHSVVDKCFSTLNIFAFIFTSVINETGRMKIFFPSITHCLELAKGFFFFFLMLFLPISQKRTFKTKWCCNSDYLVGLQV